MTDLASRIAALPEWPGAEEIMPVSWRAIRERNGYRARLALARDWIAFYPHQAGCPRRGVLNDVTGKQPPCNCGRDQLLAALQEPKP